MPMWYKHESSTQFNHFWECQLYDRDVSQTVISTTISLHWIRQQLTFMFMLHLHFTFMTCALLLVYLMLISLVDVLCILYLNSAACKRSVSSLIAPSRFAPPFSATLTHHSIPADTIFHALCVLHFQSTRICRCVASSIIFAGHYSFIA